MYYLGFAFSLKARKIMEQSNSGMMGNGMPISSPNNNEKQQKNKKQENATMFAKSNVDELFNLVKTKEGVIICVGKFKVSSKSFKSYKEADKYIASKPYEILINITVLMCKLNNEEESKEPSKKG